MDNNSSMSSWKELLKNEKSSEYFQKLLSYVESRRQQGVTVYPPKDKVFEAFKLTDFDSIRVVILGQDPYHGANQAHGLCFSVQKGVRIPPSLQNIYKELHADLEIDIPKHGFLESWAKQGVFMLNTVMTVEAGQANSHRNRGWETFTDQVIKIINEHSPHVVFLLWGSPAHKKAALIDQTKHTVLKAVHPSPLSAYRGFLGSKHFSQTNVALEEHGQTAIDWAINN